MKKYESTRQAQLWDGTASSQQDNTHTTTSSWATPLQVESPNIAYFWTVTNHRFVSIGQQPRTRMNLANSCTGETFKKSWKCGV